MKDVDDMTLEEAVEELRQMLLEYGSAGKDDAFEQRFEDLYFKLEEHFYDIKLHNFTAEIYFFDDNKKNYQITTNLITGDYYDRMLSCGYDDFKYALQSGEYNSSIQSEIDIKCAVFPIDELKQELTNKILQKVFKGHDVVSFVYLLTNPRKDVIEWALKHKEELGLRYVQNSFIEKYQAIPELKELIFKELNKEGGIK